MLADLRQALRSLARTPAQTAAALITLSLGLGAAAVVATVAYAVLLRPLPFGEPDRLVSFWPETSMSKATLEQLRSETTPAFEGIGAYFPWAGVSLSGDGRPELLEAATVTQNLFGVLGVTPALGPGFTAPDGPQPAREVLLTDGLWRRRFGADPEIVGRPVTLDGEGWTVVGVMPPEIRFPRPEVEVWVPMALDPANGDDYGSGYLSTVARLRPGVSQSAADDEILTAAVGRVRETLGMPNGWGSSAAVVGLREALVGDVKPLLLALAAAVGFVLLIVASNLAHLMLVRGLDRAREIATRAALGAGRTRLARLMLAESLALAALGGGAALLVAWWGLDLVLGSLPSGTPRIDEVAAGAPTYLFTAAAAAGIWLIVGVAPALRISRLEPAPALASGGGRIAGDRAARRRTALLVTAEIALALVLATGAALAVHSFWQLTRVDPGFRAEGLVAFSPLPPDASWDDTERRRDLYRRIEESLAAVPGVESVGAIHMVPVHNQGYNGGFLRAGDTLADGEAAPRVNWRVVTPSYFATLGIPVLQGRPLTAADRAGAPEVALVNRTLAERFWPGRDPIGQRFEHDLEEGAGRITVVGVVGDVHQHGVGTEPLAEVYRTHDQSHRRVGLSFLVRAAGDPLALAPALRGAVWDVDPAVPLSELRTMTGVLERSTAEPRLLMQLLAFFAVLALLLGAIGVYGVIAHEVHRRTREIGVRVALGARRLDVLRLVVRRAVLPVALGAAAGLIALPATGRLLESLLFGVEPGDPAIVAVVLAILVATAALAAWMPARRAARLDPIEALRVE